MGLISNRLSTASIKYLNWPSPAFDLFQNVCNKVVIEPRVVQFWSEIKLVFSNWTRAARVGELWEEHRGNREVYSKWGVPVIIHRLGGGLQSRRTMRRTQGEQRSQKQMRGTSHYLSPGRGWGGVGGLGGGTLEYYRDSWKGSGKYEKLWCSDPRPAINNDRSLVSLKGPSSDTCVACVQN